MSPSDILPPNKHIFRASCRAKKDIFLAYCVPALMTWPPLEDADVWCLAEICEWLVSLTPTCLVPFHPLTIYNMSAQLCNLQCPVSTCSKAFILQLDPNPTLNWLLAIPIPFIKQLQIHGACADLGIAMMAFRYQHPTIVAIA